MANADLKFKSIAEKISADAKVKKSRMFGFDSITVKRKTFALLDGSDMVFKLRGSAHAEALALEGAALWNPFGHEKKEWVQVPIVYGSDWEKYAGAAMDYVESLIKVSA